MSSKTLSEDEKLNYQRVFELTPDEASSFFALVEYHRQIGTTNTEEEEASFHNIASFFLGNKILSDPCVRRAFTALEESRSPTREPLQMTSAVRDNFVEVFFGAGSSQQLDNLHDSPTEAHSRKVLSQATAYTDEQTILNRLHEPMIAETLASLTVRDIQNIYNQTPFSSSASLAAGRIRRNGFSDSTKFGFLPEEDQQVFITDITAYLPSSLERELEYLDTRMNALDVMKEGMTDICQDNDVELSLEEVDSLFRLGNLSNLKEMVNTSQHYYASRPVSEESFDELTSDQEALIAKELEKLKSISAIAHQSSIPKTSRSI